MKEAQLTLAKNVVSGLNYLIMEAENANNLRIVQLLRICSHDICLYIENYPREVGMDDPAEEFKGPDLYMAMRFLSKFAVLKDNDIRREILAEIEKVNPTWRV